MSEQENDEFMAGVASVMVIRCLEHAAVPAFNHNEASGGECAACAIEGVKGFLEVEREAGRIAREKSQFQFQRANALEATVARLEQQVRVQREALEEIASLGALSVAFGSGTPSEIAARALTSPIQVVIKEWRARNESGAGYPVNMAAVLAAVEMIEEVVAKLAESEQEPGA